jgi:hypothetical protein
MPHIEYRLTDATPLDRQGRFWAIDVFYAGERSLRTEDDPLSMAFGEGKTHSQLDIVERLIELQYSPDGITLTGTPPIQLQLVGRNRPRNWEGLARLDEIGFLMVTDKWPETILGFIANPP